jgi:isoleucyl-tRNA synthetase
VDLSAIYFDILKDRLYTSAPRSRARRSAQTALYRLAYALVRLLAPVLTFTCEEVWGHLRLPGTVHIAYFPTAADLTEGISNGQRKRFENWERLMAVRDEVLKSLEAARQSKFIGAPLEARVHLTADGDLYPLLEGYVPELPGLFIVSQVTLERSKDAGLSVRVDRAEGTKCERCWKYTTDVGSHPELPTICAACAAAVVEIAGTNGRD